MDNDFPHILAGKYGKEIMAQPQREALDLSRYRASGARKAFYQMPEKKSNAQGRTGQLAEDQDPFGKYF